MFSFGAVQNFKYVLVPVRVCLAVICGSSDCLEAAQCRDRENRFLLRLSTVCRFMDNADLLFTTVTRGQRKNVSRESDSSCFASQKHSPDDF